MEDEVTVTDTAKNEAVPNKDTTADVKDATNAPKEAAVSKTYTEEDFKKAVGDQVEGAIQARVAREVKKLKTEAETALAAVTKDLETFKSDSEKLSQDLSAAQKANIKFKLAYEEKVDVSAFDTLVGDTEEELRNSLANIKKFVSSNKTSDSVNDLFDGKDYTPPPPSESYFSQAYKKL